MGNTCCAYLHKACTTEVVTYSVLLAMDDATNLKRKIFASKESKEKVALIKLPGINTLRQMIKYQGFEQIYIW